MNTSEFRYLKFPFAEFNPVQAETAQYVDMDCNLVVAAPTSSGKTVVAEMLIARTLKKKKNAIFLSPLKAVTREKYDDWTSEKHGFYERKLAIVTGDYRLTEDRVAELEEARIILLTSEMLDSRTRRIETEKNYWLYKVGICVCDEAHLLTMPGRGDNLESGLMRFTRQNPQARIVLLSATMDNVGQLAEWLAKLNGKDTRIINSQWRPVQLDVHYQNCGNSRLYYQQMDDITDAAIGIIETKPSEKFLVFCHSKPVGRKMVEKLEKAGETPKFHLSDLTLEDRVAVESSFKSRTNGTRVLVATSTLAWGINMPARNVIVLGTKRGFDPVHAIDVHQMVGRAGRYGIDDKGDSFILLPGGPESFSEKQRLMGKMEIRSQMLNDFILSFHLISEVEQHSVTTEAQAIEWYERSFAAFQGNTIAPDRVARIFSELVELGCLKKLGKTYICTPLGMVAAWLYFPPQDVAAWKRNFDRISKDQLWNSDVAISWALGTYPSADLKYWPKDLPPVAEPFFEKVRKLNLPVMANPFYGPAYWIVLSDAFGDREKKLGLPRKMQFGYERMGQALKLINQRCSKWGQDSFFEELEARISYGVPRELASLCMIPNVGAKRAKKLFDEGITTKEAALENPHAVLEALGKKTGSLVINSLKKHTGE